MFLPAAAMSCGGGGADASTGLPAGCHVSAVAVSPTTLSLAVGETRDLVSTWIATGCTDHLPVTWSTSNSSQVSLQSDGEVAHITGVAPSAAVTVTAIIGGISGRAQITVTSGPSIKLTPQSLTFTATRNGQQPLPQTVALTNGGGGVLSQVGPNATVFGPGASGWLFIQKSGLTSTAPYNLIIQPTNTMLAVGTYTATIPVTSPVASNSPQNISVTLTITP